MAKVELDKLLVEILPRMVEPVFSLFQVRREVLLQHSATLEFRQVASWRRSELRFCFYFEEYDEGHRLRIAVAL